MREPSRDIHHRPKDLCTIEQAEDVARLTVHRSKFVPIYNGRYMPPGYESIQSAFERLHAHVEALEWQARPWWRRLLDRKARNDLLALKRHP